MNKKIEKSDRLNFFLKRYVSKRFYEFTLWLPINVTDKFFLTLYKKKNLKKLDLTGSTYQDFFDLPEDLNATLPVFPHAENIRIPSYLSPFVLSKLKEQSNIKQISIGSLQLEVQSSFGATVKVPTADISKLLDKNKETLQEFSFYYFDKITRAQVNQISSAISQLKNLISFRFVLPQADTSFELLAAVSHLNLKRFTFLIDPVGFPVELSEKQNQILKSTFQSLNNLEYMEFGLLMGKDSFKKDSEHAGYEMLGESLSYLKTTTSLKMLLSSQILKSLTKKLNKELKLRDLYIQFYFTKQSEVGQMGKLLIQSKATLHEFRFRGGFEEASMFSALIADLKKASLLKVLEIVFDDPFFINMAELINILKVFKELEVLYIKEPYQYITAGHVKNTHKEAINSPN